MAIANTAGTTNNISTVKPRYIEITRHGSEWDIRAWAEVLAADGIQLDYRIKAVFGPTPAVFAITITCADDNAYMLWMLKYHESPGPV